MANPNVDKLNALYSNLAERFYDRWQDVVEGVRSGDLKATELGAATVECAMDWMEWMTAPWLLVLDGELKFRPALKTYRVTVDAAKADRVIRTKVRIGTGVTPAAQHLVKIDDNTKTIPNAHVEVGRSTTVPKDRLIITLKNLSGVVGATAGIYEGDVVDTSASNKPLAKLIVEWPG